MLDNLSNWELMIDTLWLLMQNMHVSAYYTEQINTDITK